MVFKWITSGRWTGSSILVRKWTKIIEQWFLNNKEYSREEWVDELKNIGSKHYREQLFLLNANKYNLV